MNRVGNRDRCHEWRQQIVEIPRIAGRLQRDIWISVGLRVDPNVSVATVREAVKRALLRFLAPLPRADDDSTALPADTPLCGWPLSTPVVRLQLLAIANRVPGVFLVDDVLHAAEQLVLTSTDQVDMVGVQLPRVAGISISIGNPLPVDTLRDQTLGPGVVSGLAGGPALPLPVPVIPQECQ